MMLIRSVAVARSSILFRRTTACRALATQVTTTTSTQQQRQNQQKANYALLAGAAALLGAVSAATVTLLDAPSKITPNSNEDQKDTSAIAKHLDNRPPPRPDLPTYTREQVAEHCEEDSLWFTYRGAVYDLTFFQHGHPGGAPRILMAAGQDLEPYWEVYRQHLRGHVVDWMEEYRIGNLSPEEAALTSKSIVFGDMYETDPIRHPDLLHCTEKPFNGEPRIELLVNDYITPSDLFYVRNHLAVPEIDVKDYVLIVKGKGIKKHKFTLHDLKTKFKKYEIVSTLQCAGNRREDLHSDEHKVFIAPHWVVGAMSNAKWGGVRMRDVLEYCGLDVDGMALGKVENPHIKHVQFEGYDTDETGLCFGGSIPIDKVVDGLGDCLLAFEMNGEELTRDHGYPVRAIAPGFAGARQVKWLHKVILSDQESQKAWQQKSYRAFAPDISFERDLSHWPPPGHILDQAPITQELPVQSLVCHPPQNSVVGAHAATGITLKGVAWSGGGHKIDRVDVSIDGGKTWTAADLYKPIEQKRNRHWAWTQFTKTIELTPDMQEQLKRGQKVKLDIVSKAMNSEFNVQPERMEPYWNARGVGINHWYHVQTVMDPAISKGELFVPKEKKFGNMPSGGKFEEQWGMHGWTTDQDHRTDPLARQKKQHKPNKVQTTKD